MNKNKALISKFYTAFQNKEFVAMQSCYAENAKFSDPVFPSLNAEQVKAMWEMFCKNGQELSIEFKILDVSETTVDAQWTANYIFSATDNHVINVINAHFTIEDGQITQHVDQFNFYKWSKQALGFTGLFLGWTTYLQNTVRKQAAKALFKFMNGAKMSGSLEK